MQVLTIMDTTIIWCYYHVSTLDENVNYIKFTHLLSFCFLYTLRLPYVHLPFYYEILKFYDILLSRLMPQIMSFFRLMLVCTLYEESKLHVLSIYIILHIEFTFLKLT